MSKRASIDEAPNMCFAHQTLIEELLHRVDSLGNEVRELKAKADSKADCPKCKYIDQLEQDNKVLWHDYKFFRTELDKLKAKVIKEQRERVEKKRVPVRIGDLAIGEKFVGPDGLILARGKIDPDVELVVCRVSPNDVNFFVFRVDDLVFRADGEAIKPENDQRTGLTFMEAVAAMKEGKKVRRKAWPAGIFYQVDKRGVIAQNENFYFLSPPRIEDFEATDWEIVG